MLLFNMCTYAAAVQLQRYCNSSTLESPRNHYNNNIKLIGPSFLDFSRYYVLSEFFHYLSKSLIICTQSRNDLFSLAKYCDISF